MWTEDIDINEIASKAFVSSFYFQKIFNVLCGFTVGEYIKNRRLTLAAQELCSTDIKVLDVALKYGYGSPDSFAKAFTKFHGFLFHCNYIVQRNIKVFPIFFAL